MKKTPPANIPISNFSIINLARKTIKVFVFALTMIIFSSQFASAANTTETTTDSNTGTYLTIGGFCMGGAILGSIVPIFGNIAGCALGAIGGWWVSGDDDDETLESTDTLMPALQ